MSIGISDQIMKCEYVSLCHIVISFVSYSDCLSIFSKSRSTQYSTFKNHTALVNVEKMLSNKRVGRSYKATGQGFAHTENPHLIHQSKKNMLIYTTLHSAFLTALHSHLGTVCFLFVL